MRDSISAMDIMFDSTEPEEEHNLPEPEEEYNLPEPEEKKDPGNLGVIQDQSINEDDHHFQISEGVDVSTKIAEYSLRNNPINIFETIELGDKNAPVENISVWSLFSAIFILFISIFNIIIDVYIIADKSRKKQWDAKKNRKIKIVSAFLSVILFIIFLTSVENIMFIEAKLLSFLVISLFVMNIFVYFMNTKRVFLIIFKSFSIIFYIIVIKASIAAILVI